MGVFPKINQFDKSVVSCSAAKAALAGMAIPRRGAPAVTAWGPSWTTTSVCLASTATWVLDPTSPVGLWGLAPRSGAGNAPGLWPVRSLAGLRPASRPCRSRQGWMFSRRPSAVGG
jgi:hypothetical protein